MVKRAGTFSGSSTSITGDDNVPRMRIIGMELPREDTTRRQRPRAGARCRPQRREG
jgi:hypothetical protein